MSNDEYNQKEENTFRQELFRRMDQQDRILEKLLEQTTKTNGRCTRLEDLTKDYKTDMETLKTTRTQALTIIAVFILIGSGIFYLIDRSLELKIQNAVSYCQDNCVLK